MLCKKTIFKFLACALLTASVMIQPMDKLKKKPKKHLPAPSVAKKKWAEIMGSIILGKTPIDRLEQLVIQDDEFQKLLPATRKILINDLYASFNTQSLTEASQSINSLIQNSPYLGTIINEPLFCFNLIKHYSQRFKDNNEAVAQILNTPCTLERLHFQNSFINDICKNSQLDISKFKNYLASGIDLNFTDVNNQTPAELCISLNNSEALKILLKNGVDPEYVGSDGLSLYNQANMMATMHQYTDMRTIIRVLDLAIDEQSSSEQ
jgi:hypothetical protein